MRLAYLTFNYPAISQTFVVDEVMGLRDAGFEVETLSIHRAEGGSLLTNRYREEAANTRALRPLRAGALARGHARALARHPVAYLRLAVRAVAQRPRGRRGLVLQLGAFAAAILVWDDLRRRDVRHMHVHFAGSPTHVAAMVAAFGNDAGPSGGPWTWSASVHGPVEFIDPDATGLYGRLREATFVVAISDFARRQILTGLPAGMRDKVRVVRCGIDPGDFPAHDAGTGEGPLRILYVGRLVALKGQPVLIEALERLTRDGVDAELTLVGDGPERAALERQVKAAGLEGRVTFTGALGRDRVGELYAEADVFCLPSFAEGVPVVLMEAMASGLPVVTTRIAGIPELVADGESGLLVPPGRADDLGDALAALAADPERRTSMGVRGRAKVEADHNVEQTAAQLAELFVEFRGG